MQRRDGQLHRVDGAQRGRRRDIGRGRGIDGSASVG
jgi:hypothetical protein